MTLILILEATIKSSILLVLAFIATFALRKRSASLRHLVWSVALLSAAALPAITLLLPEWRTTSGIATMTLMTPPSDWSPVAAPEQISTEITSVSPAAPAVTRTAVLLWLAGFLFAAILLFRETARMIWIARRAKPFFNSRWRRMADELCRTFAMKRPVRFLQNHTAPMLVTWGFLSPRVLLPVGADQWPDHRMRAVLGHELAHIRRHDWFIQVLAEITRAIYWFNPLVWIACSRLRLECERACDDAAIGLGLDSTEYAAELLALAKTFKTSKWAWMPSLAMARRSTLERRFVAMLNPKTDRRSVTAGTALLTLIISVCLVVPLAAMQTPVQRQTGRLFGRVYDPSGRPIKNATITAVDNVRKIRVIATTNATGIFEFQLIPVGQYEVQTSATGYADFQIHAVSVDANQEVNLNILTVASPATAAAVETVPSTLKSTLVRVPGGVQQGKIVRKVAPVYPPNLKANGIQGVVQMEAVIGKDGAVSSLRVLDNGGANPDLAKAAVEAVKQWQYKPTLVDGEPVEVITTITTNFAIQQTPVTTADTPPPPPPPPPPPQRIRQGGVVQQSKILSKVSPLYPPEAKAERIQGVVILEAVISKEGTVIQTKAISGHPILQQAAIDAVSQWLYQPTLLNGEPVEVVTTVTVNFNLPQQ